MSILDPDSLSPLLCSMGRDWRGGRITMTILFQRQVTAPSQRSPWLCGGFLLISLGLLSAGPAPACRC